MSGRFDKSGLSTAKLPDKTENDFIVIGIDFGTTFSGVSWAFSGQPNNIEVITRWASDMNFNSDTEKTPSTLLYRGIQNEAFWGYKIPAANNEDALKWFKLLLIDNKDISAELHNSPQIATAKTLLAEANKDTVNVVSSYIRLLWNHSIECITQSAGKALMRLCRFHVVVTLPAMWPDYSKARMRYAVENAGILHRRPAGNTVLSFISEPEAAALATMVDLRHRPDVKDGDHFVVCDAGGGTVDLISYQITSTSPLIVREAVRGNGRLCGAVFLDQAFIELMRGKIGPHIWDALPKDEVQRFINGDWEHGIKKQFNGQKREWIVTLPPGCVHASGTMNKKTLILSYADLDPMFRKITGKVTELVKEQIQQVKLRYGKLPKYIILVGGFGRSAYLYNHLVQEVSNDGTDVLQAQGSRPWSAICRGAVIQGLTRQKLFTDLSVTVKSRIARINYGIVFWQHYNPDVHLLTDRVWDEVEMIWKAYNQVHWYLKQGTDVFGAKSVRHSYQRLFEKPPERIAEAIHYSESSAAPNRKDSTVKKLCTITWNSKIDFEALPTFTNPIGKIYHRLEFEIEMVSDGCSLEFTVYHDGKRVAAKNICADFEVHEDNAVKKNLNSCCSSDWNSEGYQSQTESLDSWVK
nr:uncharacterized protein CTRU02_11175 [Colletotrichum truncatum]KAF6786304.1 hypothetical protein CTRU02_11175 [Colletotrichum truncatum]